MRLGYYTLRLLVHTIIKHLKIAYYKFASVFWIILLILHVINDLSLNLLELLVFLDQILEIRLVSSSPFKNPVANMWIKFADSYKVSKCEVEMSGHHLQLSKNIRSFVEYFKHTNSFYWASLTYSNITLPASNRTEFIP